MESNNPFEVDFEQYIINSSPDKKEKGKAWATAIGLQQVDGLTPSKYLYETAKRNVDGEITIQEAKNLIDSYYESKKVRTDEDDDKEEADKVSARITELLAEKAFTFNPNQLQSIHERLFKGIFTKVKAGKFRDYDITKKEWVLDGDTVYYANADLISETLKYDFETEKNFDYSKLTKEQIVLHITRFVANIWQIHPFGEGNTRTTAVFTIKYLRTLGFDILNDTFEKNSWYFRNALVRANYSNISKNIYMNTEYLEKFFRNLLLNENNELKNRYCHIRYINAVEKSSEESDNKFGIIEKSSEQILKLIQQQKDITAKEMAEKIGISSRAVEKQLKKLKESNKIQRIGSNKTGYWKLI